MPLFLVKRDVRGATITDYDAAVFRAISCQYDFDGLHWVHSYWDEAGGYSYCIYEAQDEEQIRRHSQRSHISCEEVFPVMHMEPERYPAGRLTEAESPAP